MTGFLRSRPAVPLMLASVLGYSLMAPALAFLGAASSPLAFTAFWRLGVFLFVLPLFLGFWRGTLMEPGVLGALCRRLIDRRVLVCLLAYLDLPLFSLSLRFVDPSVATVGAGVSSIMMVLVISGSHRGRGIYRRLTPPVLLLAGVSFLGFSLVVLSESGLGASGLLVSWSALLGVFISLLSGVVVGLNGFLLAWARDFSRDLDALGRPVHPYLCFLAGYVAFQLLSTVVSLSLGFVLEGPVLPVRWWALLMVGGLSYGLANPCWFLGNLWAWSPSVNVLSYLISSVSLAWLVLLGLVGVASPELLALGVVVVLGANLGIGLLERR